MNGVIKVHLIVCSWDPPRITLILRRYSNYLREKIYKECEIRKTTALKLSYQRQKEKANRINDETHYHLTKKDAIRGTRKGNYAILVLL